MTIVQLLSKLLRGAFLFVCLVFFLMLSVNMMVRADSVAMWFGGLGAFGVALAILYTMGKPVVRFLLAPVRRLLQGDQQKAGGA